MGTSGIALGARKCDTRGDLPAIHDRPDNRAEYFASERELLCTRWQEPDDLDSFRAVA
jgi:hypothetical protein